MTLDEELHAFPLTGRFLFGRLREALSREERAALEALPEEIAHYTRSARIVEAGSACNRSTLLVEGFIMRGLDAGHGGEHKRSALSVHVPGDFVDLHCFALRRLDHNIDCVGEATFGRVPHDAIARVMEQRPHLARLFWFATLLDAAMPAIGRQS